MSTRIFFPRTATAGEGFALKEKRSVATLAEATKAKPLTYTSPFTLWGMEIRSKESGRPLFVSALYKARTANFKVGFNFTIPDEDVAELDVATQQQSREGTMELALIAPPSGDIALRVNGKDARVAGPGNYVFDGEALHRAPGLAPTDPIEQAPTPNPTCGVPSLPLCPGEACATGHRFDSSACVPAERTARRTRSARARRAIASTESAA